MLNDNATLVVGAGNFFRAPTGTIAPSDLFSIDSMWENVGHTSLEDIFGITSEGGEATTLGTLQAQTLRTTYAPRTESFAFTLQQFDRAGLRLYYGSNAPLLADGSLGVPMSPVPTECAFLVVFYDGTNAFAFYAPKAEIFRADDLSVSDAESLAGLPLSVKPLVFGSNAYAYTVTPIGGIEAEGASAGTPGAFSPDGADTPYNLTALAGVTASPATAWTTGQYVDLEDGTTAYWDSSVWVAGVAA
ncbi:hypothetical protein [Salinispora tropica]|uniref:Major tail protein n=1 Tax=Salinispora tropica (strain ATCC BAA-916 / DSM 44818 / JCM 13857 / NBRC 105044 / CNB-440) TaxID=369723 RepID=A4X2B9_SALTO|nr:hypothetical protein [Salinispora tropica]ABP53019.1 hypothetical protein Strop_0536 [Salinispora tropica CNB-440]